MISVVVPAHNEAATIAPMLERLLRGPGADRLDVVVVCNGCTDDTADIARRFGVRVIEIDEASKTSALNVGDRLSRDFPRFYVDADIGVDALDLIEAARRLTDDVHAVSPRMVPQLDGRPWAVRSFYEIWLQLPYCRTLIGSGVFGVDATARQRFGEFPPIVADDLFVRLHLEPGERRVAEDATFTLHAPRNLRSLVKVKTRAHLGWLQLRELRPDLFDNEDADHAGALRSLASEVRLWPKIGVYVGIRQLTRWRARRQHRRGLHDRWERDETTRAIARPSLPEPDPEMP